MSATISDNALRILNERYLVDGETVDGLWDRVSGGNSDYRAIMSDLLFLPNSPTLFNMGTKTGGTLSACFTADTVIHTLAGDFTVAQLLERGDAEFDVFSTDGERLKIGRAFGLRRTRTDADVYRVTFDSGDQIKLTADHLVMMRDGSYCPVEQLAPGDSIMPFNHDRKGGYRIIWQTIDGHPIAAYKWAFLHGNGRWAKKGWHIHHKNYNKADDRPENLQEMTESAHASLHAGIMNPMHRPGAAEKISKHMMGNKRGLGPKPGTAAAMRGNQHALKTEPHSDRRRQYQRLWARRRSRQKHGLYNHKVVSVEYVGREDVYDLSVHKYHNFAANGVFIHNCFVFDIADALLGDWPAGGCDQPFSDSILGTTFKAACVAKAGGGVGYYLGNIRPEGSPVHSTHKKACGPVGVLHWLHRLRSLITQGGKRDLAQMAILDAHHPDIHKFIHCKDEDPKALESFNISVSWRDDWLNCVEWDRLPSGPDPRWPTVGGNETMLWWEQCQSAWRTGDPGMFFWSTTNRWNATPHLGDINATNPCGETPNISDEPCNLGSLALLRFVERVKGGWRVAWDKLKYYARIATRFLDDILDWNVFPHPDITRMARATRKLGMGVMGWADMLALLRIPYDTQDAVDLGEEVMKVINTEALDESMAMAETKGPYPAYDPDKSPSWAPRARNSTRTSVAPTGTISIIAGCEPSIEPHFALERTRTTNEGIKLKERISDWLGDLGDFVPKTANEVGIEWHVKHQAAFQKHTNLGVSKTINLPNSATVADISRAYRLMWESGCKGGTVYRDGCRNEQVLVATKKSVYSTGVSVNGDGYDKLPDDVEQLPRHKFRIGKTKCYLHVGVTPDRKRPVELFLRVSKSGSTMQGLLDSWAMSVSLALQRGTPLEQLVELHAGSRFEPYGPTSNKRVPICTSIPDYVVRYLESVFLRPAEPDSEVKSLGRTTGSGLFCPDCQSELTYAAGCLVCRNTDCNYSRCG